MRSCDCCYGDGLAPPELPEFDSPARPISVTDSIMKWIRIKLSQYVRKSQFNRWAKCNQQVIVCHRTVTRLVVQWACIYLKWHTGTVVCQHTDWTAHHYHAYHYPICADALYQTKCAPWNGGLVFVLQESIQFSQQYAPKTFSHYHPATLTTDC